MGGAAQGWGGVRIWPNSQILIFVLRVHGPNPRHTGLHGEQAQGLRSPIRLPGAYPAVRGQISPCPVLNSMATKPALETPSCSNTARIGCEPVIEYLQEVCKTFLVYCGILQAKLSKNGV